MKEKSEGRVLGRILAVEEIEIVSGARCTLPENDTSCYETATTADSGTVSDSGTTSDSGTVYDSGTTSDSGTVSDSGTTADNGQTRPVFDILIEM